MNYCKCCDRMVNQGYQPVLTEEQKKKELENPPQPLKER